MRTLRLVDPSSTSWIMGNLTRALDRLTGHNTDSSVVTGEMEVDIDNNFVKFGNPPIKTEKSAKCFIVIVK